MGRIDSVVDPSLFGTTKLVVAKETKGDPILATGVNRIIPTAITCAAAAAVAAALGGTTAYTWVPARVEWRLDDLPFCICDSPVCPNPCRIPNNSNGILERW